MTALLNPYISFDGNAREGMEFYKDVFGGTLTLSTYGEYGTTGSPVDDNKIMHARLDTPSGFTLMASDNPPGTEHRPGENITLSLSGDAGAGLEGYWGALSTGGTVVMPLEKQVWGDVFGQLVDKFGIGWMVNIGELET